MAYSAELDDLVTLEDGSLAIVMEIRGRGKKLRVLVYEPGTKHEHMDKFLVSSEKVKKHGKHIPKKRKQK